MSRYHDVEDDDEYEQAMRGLREAIDGGPLMHYAHTPTPEQVARDNAAYRKRLGIEPPPEPEAPPAEEVEPDAG